MKERREVVLGNLEDHLRNHGFPYDHDNKRRLSPAYGMNPVPLTERARELTTWISEEGPDADLDIARAAPPFFALDLVRADAIIDDVAVSPGGWQQVARRLRMSASDLAAYATAIEDAA